MTAHKRAEYPAAGGVLTGYTLMFAAASAMVGASYAGFRSVSVYAVVVRHRLRLVRPRISNPYGL